MEDQQISRFRRTLLTNITQSLFYSCVHKKINKFRSSTGSNRNSREHDREQEDPSDPKLPSHSELLLFLRCVSFFFFTPVCVRWLQLRANTPLRRSQEGRRRRRRRGWNRQDVREAAGRRKRWDKEKCDWGGWEVQKKKKRLKIKREGRRRV